MRRLRVVKRAPLERMASALLSLVFGCLSANNLARSRTVSTIFRDVRAAWPTLVVKNPKSVLVLQRLADRLAIKEVHCLFPIEPNVLGSLRLQRLYVNLNMDEISQDDSMSALERADAQTCFVTMLQHLEQCPVTELRLCPVTCEEVEGLCHTLPNLETVDFVVDTHYRCGMHILRLPVMPHLDSLHLRAWDEETFEVQGLAQQVSLRRLEVSGRLLQDLSLPNLRSVEVWLVDLMSIKGALSRLSQCSLLDEVELYEAYGSSDAQEAGKLPCKSLKLYDCDDDDFEFVSLVPNLCALSVDSEFTLTSAKIANLKSLTQLRSICLPHATASQRSELQAELPWLAILE